MSKPLIDRSQYDHPEHFDDIIREYRTSERYRPTPLEDLLYELAGYRCTICGAPWLEIHHIDDFTEGGNTEYSNLIVLCPNCHTRAHQDGIPNKKQLRLYKRKQEIAYELPILDRLSDKDWEFIREISSMPVERQVVFSMRIERTDIHAQTLEAKVEIARKEAGYLYLQESGIVSVSVEFANPQFVWIRVELTPKGIKWIRYMNEADRIPTSH